MCAFIMLNQPHTHADTFSTLSFITHPNMTSCTELVWKVARYTSAAPMYFTECENYVDGGVLANNPSEYGLTAIQNYHRQHQKRFSMSVMVSIGSGIYPAKKLGKVDAQEYLFFGKHWLKFGSELKKRAQNLLTLLTTAVSPIPYLVALCLTP